jgi:hypothetical protein
MIACGLGIVTLSKTLKTSVAYLFIFVAIIMILTAIINYLNKKRKGETFTSNAYFIISRNAPFQIVFICLMPVILYRFAVTHIDEPDEELRLAKLSKISS